MNGCRCLATCRLLLFVFYFGAFVFLASAQNPAEQPPARVELAVRAPDGKPLVQTAITVKLFGGSPFKPPIPDVTVATDGQGFARFEVPAGVYSLTVTVPKIGYGSIGTTEFLPDKVTQPEMPPLAGVGSVDVVAAAGCGDQPTVYAANKPYPVPPGSSREVHIDDLHPGNLSISASSSSGPMSQMYDLCSDFALVNVLAGRNLRVVLQPLPKDVTLPKRPDPSQVAAERALVTGGPVDPNREPIVWIRGTVRNDMGRPVPSAKVYAVATYYGGIRMNGFTLESTTDASGNYEIKGQSGLTSLTATMVAMAPGHPPAWVWPPLAQNPSQEPPAQDFVLASRGGKARVIVLREASPVEGASVALYLENADFQDIWAAGGPNDAALNAAYPAAVTNAQGVATFDDLLPGRYRVLATTQSLDMIRRSGFGQERPGGPGPNGAAGGIPVQAGQTAEFRLSVSAQSNEAAFRILKADGTPYTGTQAYKFGPVETISASGNNSAKLDSSGLGHILLQHNGFWRFDFMYRDSPMTFFPIYPPYFQAGGAIALSPNLRDAEPPTFTAGFVEPGSARVVVQEAMGRPVHATVDIMRASELARSGTTGNDGAVVFKGLYTGDQVGALMDQYFVQIRSPELADQDLVDFGKDDEPLPPPSRLRTRQAFISQKLWKQHLPLVVNKQIDVVVRAERLRYVYGVLRSSIKPRFGQPLELSQEQDGISQRATLRVLPTGEYVAGPFLSGLVQIRFWDLNSRMVNVPLQLDTRPDEPLRFDFDADQVSRPPQLPPATPRPPADGLASGGPSFMGMTGITTRAAGAGRLTGKVFLSDGTTPALGAQVLYYDAGGRGPAFFAMTDALGELHPRGLWRSAAGVDDAPQTVNTSALVAFLPGASGAVIQTSPVRAGEPVRLILPPPISLSGRVTIGAGSPSARPGNVRILAAYQGQGFLNSALSVTTAADADGRFTLAGLTPGTYLIQASLDEIWLSSPVRVDVPARNPPPLNLSIPLPGVPVVVQLLDPQGKPVVAKSIEFDHLGPLSGLWPRQWMSDAAGVVFIPTLETGRHRIRVTGSSTSVNVDVPPLPGPPARIQIRIR